MILEALDFLCARSDRPDVADARVLAEVEQRIGLAPGYAYQVLVDQVRPWIVPVRLADGLGNYGDFTGDPASHFRHAQSRLSRAGEVVLAAERAGLVPVPVGLINGSARRDGTRPSFRPERVIEAARQVIRQPQVSDADLRRIVGTPHFLTGCAVCGDLAALGAGQPTLPRLTDAEAQGGALRSAFIDLHASLSWAASQCTAPIRATCAHGQPCQSRSYMMSGSSRKASKWLARQPRLHSQATA